MKKQFVLGLLITAAVFLVGCPNGSTTVSPTITFHPNGGTGTMEDRTVAEGETFTLPSNTFTRSNCTFLGWSTSAGGDVEYADEADFTAGSADVDLYACWCFHLDDFEDGDKVNPLNTWTLAYDSGSTTISTFDPTAPPPGAGSYALEVAAEMETDQGTGPYWETLNVYTGPVGSSTPADISDFDTVIFGLSFSGSFIDDTDPDVRPEIDLQMGDGSGNSISYELLDDFAATYQEYSIALSDFTVVGSLDAVTAGLKDFRFSVFVWGNATNRMDFTLVVDDIRFE